MCQYNPNCATDRHRPRSEFGKKCQKLLSAGGVPSKRSLLQTMGSSSIHDLLPALGALTADQLSELKNKISLERSEYLNANRERIGGTAYKTKFNLGAYDEVEQCLNESAELAQAVNNELADRNPIPEYVECFPGFGLNEARLEILNDLGFSSDGEAYFTDDIETTLYSTLARLQNGETHTEQMDSLLVLPEDRMLRCATTDESGLMSHNKVYLATLFADHELAKVLDRLNVGNVSVSPMINGREVGLIYTVVNTMGESRSFSVYEHRNSDSIVINGATDWDVNADPIGPYVGNKHDVFAEFGSGEFHQAAETLGYFLQNAERSELETDEQLLANSERLDWGAIIDERIPGFQQWVKDKENERRDHTIED